MPCHIEQDNLSWELTVPLPRRGQTSFVLYRTMCFALKSFEILAVMGVGRMSVPTGEGFAK